MSSQREPFDFDDRPTITDVFIGLIIIVSVLVVGFIGLWRACNP